MSNSERNGRRLAGVRRLIEGFEARNRYQKELRALLVAMMDYMEGAHCRSLSPEERCKPGGAKDEAREFERWMGILDSYWQVLVSPEMATRRARTVLVKLLG